MYPRNGLLRHGQTGTVLFHHQVHDVIVIPQRATFENRDNRYVYVVDKDAVADRPEIVLEHELDDVYVVKKGVGPGDRIVLVEIGQVRDGEKLDYEFRPLADMVRKPKNRTE